MYQVKTLTQGSTLTTTASVYYTAPAGTFTRITQMAMINVDVVPHIVSLFLTSNSGTPGVVDTVVKDKTLQPNETWVPYQALGFVLSPGTTIQAVADANSVVVLKASGIELTT